MMIKGTTAGDGYIFSLIVDLNSQWIAILKTMVEILKEIVGH